MNQTISAKDINICYLIDNFGLQKNQDEQFFREWQDNLPNKTPSLRTGFKIKV